MLTLNLAPEQILHRKVSPLSVIFAKLLLAVEGTSAGFQALLVACFSQHVPTGQSGDTSWHRTADVAYSVRRNGLSQAQRTPVPFLQKSEQPVLLHLQSHGKASVRLPTCNCRRNCAPKFANLIHVEFVRVWPWLLPII
ncbi:hypothetical protein MRX96_033085 [Rhipicephalus microplus]